jgi:PHD/YefM family antitoxin component YafN of YafNO toxin-antitoxin module
MSPDDLESLEESLDILRDDELMESLRRSRQEAAEGKRLRLRDHA